MNTNTGSRYFWKSHNDKIILAALLVIFIVSSLTVALRLKPGIIPDEIAHFTFANHFSTTWGIPPDTYETSAWGWYIEQNPILNHWLNGRWINLITFIQPAATDWQILVILRVINLTYAIGTVLFCFLLSKEVIKNKWWQLLPVFMLTNTLMFVFLAGGVNYDNLANLFSMAGLYFLIRVLSDKNFLSNSLAWLVFIALGTLVKFPILPLALAMTVVWLVYIATNRKKIGVINFSETGLIILLILFASLAIINFSIYGINLIRHQSLTPPCREILLEAQCDNSPWERRARDTALPEKLTIRESIELGYPSPIGYALVDWVYHMILRTYGVTGYFSYFPFHLDGYYQFLFYWIATLGVINFVYFWKKPFSIYALIGIAAFYTLVLLYQNYQSELVYGFQQIAFQGRYIFPVIGAIYVLFTRVLQRFPVRIIGWLTLAYTLALLFYGGLLTILLGYQTIFSGWFL